MVKELRERTGAGIKECKDTLLQTDGNMDQAVALLREKGIEAAVKKQSREAREGRIDVYIHTGSKLAAMVEMNCETDFVARTDDFMALTREIAMHIAATNPTYLAVEDVPADVITQSGIPAEQFYEQHVLMAQPFVKDGTITIEDKIKESIARIGENILVRRFARFEVGD
jgi:elongation factor Ts